MELSSEEEECVSGLLLELDIYTTSQTLEVCSAIYATGYSDEAGGGDTASHEVV